MSADAKFWPVDVSQSYDGAYSWAWVSDATDGVQDCGHTLDEAILAARIALSAGRDKPLALRLEPRTDASGAFYLAGWI